MKSWDEVKSNPKTMYLLLIAGIFFLLAILMIQTAGNHGWLYDNVVKPEVTTQEYTLKSQYIGNITDGNKEYANVLMMDVVDQDGIDHTFYFANENTLLPDIIYGDSVTVVWVQQKIGTPYIHGVFKTADTHGFNMTEFM